MTMPSWNRVARWAGYAGFFLFTVLVFVVLTFPSERVARFAEHKLSKALKAKVTIGDLDINGLSEVELFDVVLDFDVVVASSEVPKGAADKEENNAEEEALPEGGEPPGGPGNAEVPKPDAAEGVEETPGEHKTKEEAPTATKKRGGKLKIDYLRIGAGLTDMIFGGATDVVVDAELLGGMIEGAKITYDGGKIRVEVPHLKNLKLDNNPIIAKWMPYDLTGVLNAKADFVWGGSLSESKGFVELTIELSGGWGGNRIVGTLGVVFTNFSTRNFFKGSAWRPLPSGDGQRLSVRMQTTGLFYQSYNLSFTEPWLGGKKPTSLTTSVYHSVFSNGERRFLKDSTDVNGDKIRNPNRQVMKTTGIVLGLGKRLKWPDDFFTVYHEVSYQYYDLRNYVGAFIFTNGYANNLSYRFSLARNSSDQPIFPRTGSQSTFSLQVTPPYSAFRTGAAPPPHS